MSKPYFTLKEFCDPSVQGSETHTDLDLLNCMNQLRHTAKCPIITHWKVGGCIDVNGTHGHAKHSYHLLRMGCKACDFHFNTDKLARQQIWWVLSTGLFRGIGVYYDWHWNNKPLRIGFHVDRRPTSLTQIWTRRGGQYIYTFA